MYNLSIPFKTTDIYNGLAEGEGMLHARENGVVLEFQVKDALFGVIKSEPKSLFLPYHQLAQARFRGSFWGSRFRLHVNSMQLLSQYPASKNGIIKLKVKKAFKQKAIEMETFINSRIHQGGIDQPILEPKDANPQLESRDPFLG